MSLLWGLMCIFVACSPSSNEPQVPNLVVTATPAGAVISVAGGMQVTTLAEESTTLESHAASSTSFYAAPGSYYTVQVQADDHTSFTRRVWVRDDRRIELNIGLARKGGKSGSRYTEAFEAETATAGTSFDVGEDDLASAGGFLVQPPSIANTEQAREDAFIRVSVPSAGQYTLWARMYATSDATDAIYLGFNGQLERTYPETKGEYVWVKAAETRLEAGSNKISIGHGESGARLDLLVVTNDSLSTRDLGAYVTMVAVSETPIAPRRPANPVTPGRPAPEPEPEPTPASPVAPDVRAYALRGDPNFSPSQLSSEERLWYDRLWAAIKNPGIQPDVTRYASQDNIYEHARHVSTHNRALLMAFRVTGDLRLLDEVDRLAQLMRSQLRDGWCSGVPNTLQTRAYGTVSGRDGYLNWVQKVDPSDTYNYCRDVHELEEPLAHGHIALLMYAFHLNRDLKSPSGVDYGERADFWLDYLRNHFEAKWRERSGVAFPNMNFFERRHYTHTHMQLLMYFYYVGKRLEMDGDPDAKYYLDEARKMTDQIFDTPYIRNKQAGGFVDVETPLGTAIVYAWGTPYYSSDLMTRATPTIYARRVIEAMLELHLEGFYRWSSEAIMRKAATGLAYFIMDTDDVTSRDTPFAASVTGEQGAGGIPPSNYRGRIGNRQYAISSYSFLAPWDSSGRVYRISKDVYDNVVSDPDKPWMVATPASMFFYAALQGK